MRPLFALAAALCALSCAADPVLLPDASGSPDAGPCGGACGAGTVCMGGACVAVVVDGGALDTGTVDAWSDAGAVDVPVALDVPPLEDIGVCRPACGPGAECVGVACRCTGTLRACAGACVDTTSDPGNCGACGRACLAGQACNGGNCGCAPGRQTCGTLGLCGSEIATDIFNCGACGNRCTTAQTCTAGRCVADPRADAGCFRQTQCGTQCVDLARDSANCQACGRACRPGEVCGLGADGGCGTICGTATLPNYCPNPDGGVGGCTNLSADPMNCGACGRRCMCNSGRCL